MLSTIFALSTPLGGAIAIIRISGPKALEIISALTGGRMSFKPRQLCCAAVFNDGEVIDDAMVVCFCAPNSYTGEDMAEIHSHGSRAVINALSHALLKLGARPAEAGEFTRRAFMNGKLDLTKAEAVMDLINAEASLSGKAALRQMHGMLSRELFALENDMLDILSAISAAIDYPEEIEEDVTFALPGQLAKLETKLNKLISEGSRARILREGFYVTIAGAPNAGKSSLLNVLLGEERAIVTSEPGTTRDTLEELVPIEGIPVVFTDTAGVRETSSEAERQGVERALGAIASANAVLLVIDGSKELSDETRLLLEKTADCKSIIVASKSDLPHAWEESDISAHNSAFLRVSSLTGEGIDELKKSIAAFAGNVGGAYITNARHIEALNLARASIKSAMDDDIALDCVAIELRSALLAIGAITGSAVDEDVISKIFLRFCVGK